MNNIFCHVFCIVKVDLDREQLKVNEIRGEIKFREEW